MDLSSSSTLSLFGKLCLAAALSILLIAATVDAILLQVNDQVVTLSQFKSRLAQVLADSRVDKSKMKEMVNQVYDQVLTEELMVARAKEEEITVDDETLKHAKGQLMKQNHITTEEEFAKAVRAAGLTVKGIEDKLKHDILAEKVLYSEVYTQRDVTEWELEKFYKSHSDAFKEKEGYHVATLILLSDQHNPPQLASLKDVVTRALAEKPFEDVVKTYTEGPAKDKGGDLGVVTVADISPNLIDLIKTLKDGEVGGPLETSFGLQWVRLIKHIPARTAPLKKVRKAVQELYLKEKYKDNYDAFIEKLKRRYYIAEHKDLLEELYE